ncbi:major capsid protein [Thalassobaculum litoreum]|uniref:Encapsulating protein for peroxidase n=1 Tax=Thalassobaculum litoreum DSM 18839 TaxID=1123362 RepID=A0A8G2BI14_9PROT|nr:major capsid protein [Thalassobaculum litoreum]SDF83453.1 Encapsulating protein for peroxidase [Thalassobaculum litoreum DSM 18839]
MNMVVSAGAPANITLNGAGSLRDLLVHVDANPMNFVADIRAFDRTLPEDAWKQIDQRIIQIASERLPLTSYLMGRGLIYPLTDFLGTPILQTQKASDMEDADISMEPTSRGALGRQTFSDVYLPIPIIHKPIDFSVRMLRAAAKAGQPIDLTTFLTVMRKVMERVEDVFVNGAASITVTVNSVQGSVSGLTSFSDRNTVDLTTNWDASGKTGAQILDDVQDTIDAARSDNMYGPFLLCVPKNYQRKLGDDYSTAYRGTIRQRLLELEEIENIMVVDQLADDNVVLLQLTEDTVQVIDGLRPAVIPLVQNELFVEPYLGMACMLPYLKSDKDGRCGIVHLRPAP